VHGVFPIHIAMSQQQLLAVVNIIESVTHMESGTGPEIPENPSVRNDKRPVLVWFRGDLRLSDHPALSWAVHTGRPVVPVFVLDDSAGVYPGEASRWWLHGSLQALNTSLEHLGSRLILRRGPPVKALMTLVRETGAAAIAWSRQYDPAGSLQGTQVQAWCDRTGIESRSFNASLLIEPWDISTGSGLPYRVFTPFWRRCLARAFEPPQSEKPVPAPPDSWPVSEKLEEWRLRSAHPDWAAGLRKTWQPGEEGAWNRLDSFLREGFVHYHRHRDQPGRDGTSMLSAHLHFGEIGPRQIVAALDALEPGPGLDAFMRQIGWREFCHHLLFHNPDMETASLRPEFDRMPWRDSPADLRRWQLGQTGYPLVDAGMRELWTTGWMHNRVRMITASFLTKHLLIDWRLGADWFLDTLVDADRANNSAGWQWVAGCGTDAAPYFRIFNPVTQSKRFDPSGRYLRTWLPELRRLPDQVIHTPWSAPRTVLADAGVRLGKNYPRPAVDHAQTRLRALEIYETRIRSGPGKAPPG